MSRHGESLAIPFWLPLLSILVYLALGLGDYGLLDNNEGLYAEIGREMARGSSLIIPHVLGEPYLEKPPLLYYLVALSLSLFGDTALAARLVPLSASLLTLATIHWFCSRLGRPQTGRLAVVILASSLGYTRMSGVVMFDMLFTTFFTLSLFSFWLAWVERNRKLLLPAAAGLALALLTKGFLALALFGLVLASHFIATERHRIGEALRFLLDPMAIALFLLLAIPWHLAASMADSRFAWFYFINEHVLRFMGKRIPHDYYGGPWWYYLPRLLGFLFPWSTCLPLMFFRGQQGDDTTRRLSGFLLAAWLAPLVFFSLSSAKANYYMVVGLPALGIALALKLESLVAAGRSRLLAWPLGLAALAGLAASLMLALRPVPRLSPAEVDAALSATSAIVALALVGLWVLFRRHVLAALIMMVLLLLPPRALIQAILEGREPELSARLLASSIEERCRNCRVAIYRDFEDISSLPFYLKTHPLILDSASNDLWFAYHQTPPGPAFADSASLAARTDGPPLAVVVLDKRLAEFAASPLSDATRPALRLGKATVFMSR